MHLPLYAKYKCQCRHLLNELLQYFFHAILVLNQFQQRHYNVFCQNSKHFLDVYYFDKTRYSAFVGTDLELKLRERNIEEVHLVGVCTDICILHTAVDAYNKGFKIVVHKDAVASFNDKGHEWALTHFTSTLGAKVI